MEAFATASAPFRAHVYTAALWYGGSDRAYADRVYRRTFADLFASGARCGASPPGGRWRTR